MEIYIKHTSTILICHLGTQNVSLTIVLGLEHNNASNYYYFFNQSDWCY